MPLGVLRKQGSGYYAKLVGDQVNEAFVVLDYAFLRNIILLIRMVVVLGIVLVWSKVLFVMFAANVALVVLYTGLADRYTHQHFTRGYELIRRSIAHVVETFDNLHEILAGESSKARLAKYCELSDEFTAVGVKTEVVKANLDVVLAELPSYISYASILAYSGIQVLHGHMTIGMLWAAWSYIGYAIEPMYILKELSRVAVQSASNLEVLLSYFSNALNVLLGFERSFEGDVYLCGSSIRDLSPEEVFRVVGYYSQSVGLFNDTLEANIIMGRPREETRLRSLIERLGLEGLAGRSLGEGGSFVSGGQAQRIQLARLLYADKPIFVIDELAQAQHPEPGQPRHGASRRPDHRLGTLSELVQPMSPDSGNLRRQRSGPGADSLRHRCPVEAIGP